MENKKYSLEDKKWGEFEIGRIFEIKKCKCSNASKLEGNGNVPYVGATTRNNGVMKFVKMDEKLITKGNCIVFICDGEGSIGLSMYKKEDFIGSTTLKVGINRNFNKYIYSFISTCSDTVRSKYNFGFKRNENHLKKEKILLPLDKNQNPDWEFMENYMKQIEAEKLQNIISYYKQKCIENDLALLLERERTVSLKLRYGKSFGLKRYLMGIDEQDLLKKIEKNEKYHIILQVV